MRLISCDEEIAAVTAGQYSPMHTGACLTDKSFLFATPISILYDTNHHTSVGQFYIA